jgi:inner membrane protein
MDSITHIALGGLLGEVLLGKKLGKRAIVLGAIAQSIPDMDIVASSWLDVPHDLLAHRGFTHSFLFVALLSPLLALAALRWLKHSDLRFRQWLFFFVVQISIHLLLDSLNAYGTGWLEPFSHTRFSFSTLFVADPFYTVWLVIVLGVLILLRRAHPSRWSWAVAGLVVSSLYLVYAGVNKYIVTRETEKILQGQQVSYQRYFTTPTPLNTWLWMIVAEDSRGYQVGYRSVFDSQERVSFHFFPRNDSLLKGFSLHEDVKLLQRFSQGYYTVTQRSDTLVFSDLRFGQRLGWDDPEARFVFEYFVNFPGENTFAVQRGRFAGWNRDRVGAMVKRIKGN